MTSAAGGVQGATPSRQRVRRNAMILDAVEDLLTRTPLRELNVEDIAEAAGIARTRFYVYYKNKFDAYAAVLGRLSEQVLASYEQPGGWYQRPRDVRPRESLIRTFHTVVPLWWRHRAVLREASDMWNTPPDQPDQPNQWRAVMAGFTEHARQAIERERELGIAPPGVDAGDLAEFLMWQTERMLFLCYLDDREPDDRMAEVAVEIWMRSIYLDDDPDPC